jgi:hypothetical protein
MVSATQSSLPQKIPFLEHKTFDEILVVEGAIERRYSFVEFCSLPLNRRVHLLLCKQQRFFREGTEISRTAALFFQH